MCVCVHACMRVCVFCCVYMCVHVYIRSTDAKFSGLRPLGRQVTALLKKIFAITCIGYGNKTFIHLFTHNIIYCNNTCYNNQAMANIRL